MKSFHATETHNDLNHFDLLSIITIESPYRMTNISGLNHGKEKTPGRRDYFAI